MRRSRLVPAVAGLLLAGLALSGCSASGSSAAACGGGSAGRSSAVGPAAASVRGAVAAAERAVVTTGSLRLVTADPVRAAGRIGALVDAAGGTVARDRRHPEGDASASLRLRVPAAAFARTLAAIERQGDARDVTVSSTDVTARVTDYGVRIANLRTSIGRLQQLLRTATSSSALVEIEGALTDRQGRLEQLLAEQRTLEDQVALSTLDVALVGPAAAPAGPHDFVGGLVAGTRGLLGALSGLAVAAGVVLPWAVVLGALGAAAALAVRLVRRRARTA